MKADLIIHHAKIYTVDSTMPWAEAVACRQGQIMAVGSNDEIRQLAGSSTKLINAHGRLVLPGLIDAHVHFLNYTIRRHEVNLFGVKDFAEVRRRVQAAVQKTPPGGWVQGWGWDETFWDVQPTRAQLDDLAPDTPVLLRRLDMHTYWLNSAALNLAHITTETPTPPGSQIERDETGRPTGLLREWNALQLIEPLVPAPQAGTLKTWLEETIPHLHSLGLTSIHDQRVLHEGPQSFHLLQALNREGKLNLRIHMNIAAENLDKAAALGLHPGFGNDRLWIGHVKTFADGTMGSRTAWMIDPFEGEPDNRGVVVTSAEQLWNLAEQAQKSGFSMSVHAIGDMAVRQVIDVLSELPPPHPDPAAGQQADIRPPHRIEHVQIIHPDDLARLNRHNIIASMQPIHLSADWQTADRVWGQRARYVYALRSLLEHGTRLALGSDAPVAPLNPMYGIYAAVARRDLDGHPDKGWYPEERISVAEAVYGFTIGAATAAGKQHRQGSITPGKWADLIMLSQNIFEISSQDIPHTIVDLTIFDGQIVHYPEGEVQPPKRNVLFAPIVGPEFR